FGPQSTQRQRLNAALFNGETTMKKTLLLAAAVLALGPLSANAQDLSIQGDADIAVDTAMTAPESAPERFTLENGGEILVEGDAVYVMDADGAQKPAPDGTYTLSDGTTLTTSG